MTVFNPAYEFTMLKQRLLSKYQVFMDKILIGHSDLECGDPPMGVVSGIFLPLPVYERFSSQLIILRDASQKHLMLSVIRPNDELIPAQVVKIYDYSTELGEIQIELIGIAYPLYEELFPDLVAGYHNRF